MIRFDEVSKSFGSRTILDRLSLEIPGGKIVFILGMSGTGKSVLLKNIVGLLKPDSGSVWVNGIDVAQLSELEMNPIRKVCGMAFQQPALFDFLDVFGNVSYGLRRHFNLSMDELRKRVIEALETVGLQGLENKKVHELSYGMQKRVSLARTVALKPKILLFDEPTTGLDPISTSRVNELILNLTRELGTTSVVVSHDMKSALDVADHIIVLDKGGVLDQGTPGEIRKSTHKLIKDFLSEV